jgi:glucose/arabinose dehydrogenase
MTRAGSGLLVVASLVLLEACHSSSDDGNPTPPPPPPLGTVIGLDARPSNLSCVAPAKTPSQSTTIRTQRFTSLAFSAPIAMLQAPGDDSRWYVVEQSGTVRVFPHTSTPAASDFISVAVTAGQERGLLGMAFHPQWATNRYVYLSFTEGDLVSVVARYTMSADGMTADPDSRFDIIRVTQPFDNHNGGHIAFGRDGYLYFGLGDGGSGGDPLGTAQDTTDLLGSMLRLDVDTSGEPYEIPADNPFAGRPMCTSDHATEGDSCPEIYAWGFRNPWRWSFDSANGDLWLGDVGQAAREEISRVERGGNYGWNCREGTIPFSSAPAGTCSVAAGGLIDPVHDYDRSLGVAVTGGFVYRGSALPGLFGDYLFADFYTGRIWRLVPNGAQFASQQLLDTSLAIASFGEGNDGELYLVDYNGGLHRIVAGDETAPPAGLPVPTQLSETGCVNPQNPSLPASGLVPYEPAAPFWSDNATKERWLALPNGTAIGRDSAGDFDLPNGAVLMKHFRLNNQLIETRLLMRHPDGDWAGYTYEWNAQRTDATLVQGGKDCLTCHTPSAGFSLSLEAAQLNHGFTYASTGRTANQLRTLDAVTMFTTPLGDPALQPAMPDPFDTAAPLGQRARAYLHTNCAQCHRTGGPTPSSMDLRYSTLLAGTNACNAVPQTSPFGMVGERIIAPGAPDLSLVATRMNRRDSQGMPPLASSIPDAQGVALIRQWIASLTTCQ